VLREEKDSEASTDSWEEAGWVDVTVEGGVISHDRKPEVLVELPLA